MPKLSAFLHRLGSIRCLMVLRFGFARPSGTLLCGLLVMIGWPISPVCSANDITPIRYWNGTAARDQYEIALLQLALAKTSSDYPPYHLTRLEADLGSDRARHELARGELINVYASPYRIKTGPIEAQIIQIPIPLLKGLLGYRELIVRRSDLAQFSAVKEIDDLRPLVVGQGRGWPDVAIYKHNGFKVMDEGLFDNLFAMLELGRFDCFPLGIIEAQNTLQLYGGEGRGLAIVPDLRVYYPWPVFYHVSSRSPELAQRIEEGLKLAVADGSFDALFLHHYGELVEELKFQNNRTIVLENPSIRESIGLSEPQLTALGL